MIFDFYVQYKFKPKHCGNFEKLNYAISTHNFTLKPHNKNLDIQKISSHNTLMILFPLNHP